MEHEKKAIAVPWDFTEKCEYALEHAANLAKTMDKRVFLVHFASSDSKKNGKIDDLKKIAAQAEEKYKIKPEVFVKTGDITSSLKDVIAELGISMVVMKTDGVKGMQKYFGSRALKAIYGCTVPFVVVQDKPRSTEYKNIVFPIDYSFESKEKLHWIKFLSKYFKTQIQIITPDISDGTLRNKIKNNVIFARNILSEESIQYEIIVGAGKGEFGEAIMRFANKVEADIIIVMAPKEIGFRDYLNGSKCQRLLANKYKVPILCINPRQLRRFSGFGG